MPSGDQATHVRKHRARRTQPQNKSLLRNIFAPLRLEMEKSKGDQQKPTSQADRPAPIILTSQLTCFCYRKKLRGFVKSNFEFLNTRNRTAIKSFQNEKLSFFTFHPKSKRLS